MRWKECIDLIPVTAYGLKKQIQSANLKTYLFPKIKKSPLRRDRLMILDNLRSFVLIPVNVGIFPVKIFIARKY